AWTQAPAGSVPRFTEAAPARLISPFDESHAKVVVTFVASDGPVLQSVAPTGKVFGPVLTLLLSRPMTFHEFLVRVSAADAGRASSTTADAHTMSDSTHGARLCQSHESGDRREHTSPLVWKPRELGGP